MNFGVRSNQLDANIFGRKPDKQENIFPHDNEHAYRCVVTRPKLTELNYGLSLHPAYSHDLAPSDFYLFSYLEK